ncbi:YraN family protein [candidate division WOR-3 bacterium]|nr:YraN family protein [candidate division WOR-3 bacterium]
MKPKPLGRKGEGLAAAYLRDLGWEIVERNYRTRLGEIDLVCRDHGTTVFVEVKTRTSSEIARPDQSVTQRKQAKLRRLIEDYLVKHNLESSDVRFDVLGVTLCGRQPEYEHIVGAL